MFNEDVWGGLLVYGQPSPCVGAGCLVCGGCFGWMVQGSSPANAKKPQRERERERAGEEEKKPALLIGTAIVDLWRVGVQGMWYFFFQAKM